MDFSIPAETRTLMGDLRDFLNAEITPLEARAAAEGWSAVEPALEAAREKVKAAGWWLPQMPAEQGGMGLSLMDFAHVSEVLGRSPLGHYVFNCQAPDAGNMEILSHFGTPEQKARWLAPLLQGELRSCFAMTEPDMPGSNPVMLATSAVKDGDDYIIDGHKWFTTGADGAAFAIVMAVTNPDSGSPYASATQIIVPTDSPGFRHVRNVPVMGEAGEGYASHGELRFEGCRVPQSHRLGGEGAGFMIAQERLGPGRIHHCMRWIGICERAFDLMCQRAVSRQISPGKPLSTRQMLQEQVATSRAEIDAARLMVLRTAWRIDHEGAYAARTDVSLIKFLVAGVLQRVLDRAIQAHGALGITDDLPLAWWWRHERGARIYDGPDEVHKAVVARRILKQYTS